MNGLQPYMIGPHRKTLLLLRLQLLPSILSPHFIKTMIKRMPDVSSPLILK